MRLFIAIDPPDPIKAYAEQIASELRPALPHAHFVAQANRHLTLKFDADGDLDEMSRRARHAAKTTLQFSAHLTEVGTFGRKSAPTVLWLGLEGEGFVPLIQSLNSTSDRAFIAHLTLARLTRVRSVLPDVAVEHLSFDVNEIALFRSELSRQGPRYEILDRFPLVG